MDKNKIIIEQKNGYTIHGIVGINGRIGQFTVTPDYLNVTYHLVKDAQKRVYDLLKKEKEVELRKVVYSKK